jgi:hypothetical protein
LKGRISEVKNSNYDTLLNQNFILEDKVRSLHKENLALKDDLNESHRKLEQVTTSSVARSHLFVDTDVVRTEPDELSRSPYMRRVDLNYDRRDRSGDNL